MGKSKFQKSWLDRPEYKDWLQEDRQDKHRAFCGVCRRSFDVTNMGEAALKSHSTGTKHVRNLQQIGSTTGLARYFKPTATTQSVVEPGVTDAGTTNKSQTDTAHCSKQQTLQQMVCPGSDETWTAEVLWAMKVVSSHYSYKSSTDIEKLFQKMFPNSSIAKSFSCGEKKCAYIVSHGLAPYFKKQLDDQLSTLDSFVVLFDESFNESTQSSQMDIHVRFFDEAKNEVNTRYFNSGFLGHATADLMVTEFTDKCSNLNLMNMTQLSMDGPNVNWSFYEKLMGELYDDQSRKLVDIGSCGLHIIHNAFKAGFDSTPWDIKSFLCALHRIFHQTPARREDFVTITDSNIFPLQFCPHRWVENSAVASRALLVLENVKTYVKTIAKYPRKYTVPNSKSFQTVKEGCDDPLMPAKLMFFESVSRQFNKFLIRYQTDKPMVPFLSKDLEELVRGLCKRFLKKSSLDNANSVAALVKLNVADSGIQLPCSAVDPGFSAAKKLKELRISKVVNVNERQVLQFLAQCRDMLVAATSKLLVKCPLTYTMTRNLACMDPCLMTTNKDDCVAKFRRVLHKLVFLKQVNEIDCDSLQWEYEAFLDEVVSRNFSKFKDYSCDDQRLDTFLSVYMNGLPAYDKLWQLTKKLLILSHGQATVERGFSINAQLIVENMKEKSVVSQRLVHNAMANCGGLLKTPITKSLLSYAASARRKYMAYLEDQKQQKSLQKSLDSKRKSVGENMEQLEAKKRRVENDIEALQSSADKLAESAEASGDLTLLTKSNALRKCAKQKSEELHTIQKQLEDLPNL